MNSSQNQYHCNIETAMKAIERRKEWLRRAYRLASGSRSNDDVAELTFASVSLNSWYEMGAMEIVTNVDIVKDGPVAVAREINDAVLANKIRYYAGWSGHEPGRDGITVSCVRSNSGIPYPGL